MCSYHRDLSRLQKRGSDGGRTEDEKLEKQRAEAVGKQPYDSWSPSSGSPTDPRTTGSHREPSWLRNDLSARLSYYAMMEQHHQHHHHITTGGASPSPLPPLPGELSCVIPGG
ncbi:unnamed protein product [Pleuronectes platessa]|uniref:Uncharacterized protein n=1 Tax=Pleuronectes platessa TaxID=8262 RepID=A0A9N7YJA3_PLEPL|nr:unnamed protein product [Pleuronectes platessa]